MFKVVCPCCGEELEKAFIASCWAHFRGVQGGGQAGNKNGTGHCGKNAGRPKGSRNKRKDKADLFVNVLDWT